eukprot:TRINITY_DN13902_c0_g1_i1.p1 TRINITY_DN13902_c0_g1~~TRINITY_DN13902_c0_g1_i1.p1  ORF type:complete len:252 (+),score=36.59 TRINITY_DN13902_c0_g1_i1:64-756(+)
MAPHLHASRLCDMYALSLSSMKENKDAYDQYRATVSTVDRIAEVSPPLPFLISTSLSGTFSLKPQDEFTAALVAIKDRLHTAHPGSSESDRAHVQCRKLLRRLESLMSASTSAHAAYSDALQLSATLRRHLRLFADMASKYPKRPDGSSVVHTTRGSVSLCWKQQCEGSGSLLIDDVQFLVLTTGGELYVSPSTRAAIRAECRNTTSYSGQMVKMPFSCQRWVSHRPWRG